jgi:hypothetical protein
MSNFRWIGVILFGLSVLVTFNDTCAQVETGNSIVPKTSIGTVSVRKLGGGTSDFTYVYTLDLSRRLKRAWFPVVTTERVGPVSVSFRISKIGAMSNLELQEKSLNPDADRAAMTAVQNAAPFRPWLQDTTEYIDVIAIFREPGAPDEPSAKELSQLEKLRSKKHFEKRNGSLRDALQEVIQPEKLRSKKLFEVIQPDSTLIRGDFGSNKLEYAPGLGTVKHSPESTSDKNAE